MIVSDMTKISVSLYIIAFHGSNSQRPPPSHLYIFLPAYAIFNSTIFLIMLKVACNIRSRCARFCIPDCLTAQDRARVANLVAKLLMNSYK
jgi:hypothetical protein